MKIASKNILLIDDDAAVHIYHKLMIKQAGFNERLVKSFIIASEALEYLSELANSAQEKLWPDYIFVDIHMPLKSGYDFVQDYLDKGFDQKLPDIYLVSTTRNPSDVEKIESIDAIKGVEVKFLNKAFFESLKDVMQD